MRAQELYRKVQAGAALRLNGDVHHASTNRRS